MDERDRAARLAAAVTAATEMARPHDWHRKCAEHGTSKAVELAVRALEQAAAIESATPGSSARRDRFGALAAALRANPADSLTRDVVQLARECAMPILVSSTLRPSSPEPPRGTLPSARAMAVGGAYTDAYSEGDKRGLYLAAIRQYAAQLAKNPADTRTLMKLGDLRLRTGDVCGAIECYWQAGDVFAADSEHVRAYAVYRQVQQLFSQWPDVATARDRADVEERVAAFESAAAVPRTDRG